MSFQTDSIDADGLARTSDGRLYVKAEGGVPILLAQSFVAASAAADTTENTLATITVPAGVMGTSGAIRVISYWTFTSSANNKVLRVRWGGASGTDIATSTMTTTTNAELESFIGNRGAANSQIMTTRRFTTSSSIIAYYSIGGAVNTAAETTIVLTGQKALDSETLTLAGYQAFYLKPAA